MKDALKHKSIRSMFSKNLFAIGLFTQDQMICFEQRFDTFSMPYDLDVDKAKTLAYELVKNVEWERNTK